jgi:hypothetical protein
VEDLPPPREIGVRNPLVEERRRAADPDLVELHRGLRVIEDVLDSDVDAVVAVEDRLAWASGHEERERGGQEEGPRNVAVLAHRGSPFRSIL